MGRFNPGSRKIEAPGHTESDLQGHALIRTMLMLPILMYHKIDAVRSGALYVGNYVLPSEFNAQLKALNSAGYTAISLEDWLDFRSRRRRPPSRPVVITFDDGYASNYAVAWPLLQRHGATATIFLVADLIGKTNSWDANQPQEHLLRVPEILQMQEAGMRFGSHTRTHRSLIDISRAEVLTELVESKAKLENILGRAVTALAYPYNKQNSAVRALARQAGYQTAVLGRGRINASWTNPWMLRRIRVDLHMTATDLVEHLAKLRWLPGL
jgi:peptidoglycan/xylan/chitin deacetylase (PgdA/CDA1 family)